MGSMGKASCPDLPSALSYPTAENTEGTYGTPQLHDQLLHNEMARCFRIAVVVAAIKPLTTAINGGFFSPTLLPGSQFPFPCLGRSVTMRT